MEGFMKLNATVGTAKAMNPPLQATLWRCGMCNSFISIHAPQLVTEPLCPICGDVAIEFCGRFQSIFGLEFADA